MSTKECSASSYNVGRFDGSSGGRIGTRGPNSEDAQHVIPKPHRILASEMSAQQRNALLDGLVAQVVTLTREANADRARIDRFSRQGEEWAGAVDDAVAKLKADYDVLDAHVRWHQSLSFLARLRWLLTGR